MRKRQWLATHKKIVVGGETDWAPFDFVDETSDNMPEWRMIT